MKRVYLSLIVFGSVFLPLTASAFFNFCFPITFVIGLYLLMWPYWLIASIVPPLEQLAVDSASVALLLIFGFVVDIALLYLIGKKSDNKNKKISTARIFNRWTFRLPVGFAMIILIFCILIYFELDPTCW